MEQWRIVRVLRDMATLLEIAGANPFEIMAYRNGADAVDEWPDPLEDAVARGTLTEIPGVGKGLSKVITELVQEGRSSDHQRLLEKFPPGLPDVLKVPGLGPKKVKALFEELGIASLDDLEQAVHQQRIRTLRGFGPKSEESILTGIERARERIAKRKEG